MIGGLFRKKDAQGINYGKSADKLYATILTHVRNPVFYKEYGVPDSFDGRFDLLLVHVFIALHVVMEHEDYEEISQSLFDTIFQDMDQTLREMGIGDMGVPKHMKRMMKAFNGRMHVYQMAINPDSLKDIEIDDLEKISLQEALKRNLYATVSEDNNWNEEYLFLMEGFILKNIDDKSTNRIDHIMSGDIEFVL